MRKTLLLVALGFAIAAVALGLGACASAPASDVPTVADLGWEQGDAVVAVGYCLTEESVRHLADVTTERNSEGYKAVMSDPQVPCFDARMHPIAPLRIVLVERLFSIIHEDGRSFVFWKALTAIGMFVYIGLPPKAAQIEEGDDEAPLVTT